MTHRLNTITDNPGARKNRKRVGRGIGSGRGGHTATHGQKGQKSRTGVAINGFEGGQMPLYRRLPKRGFHNPASTSYAEVNVGRLQQAVDAGKLDEKSEITDETLVTAGVVTKLGDGVRILGKGTLKAKLTLNVTSASSGGMKAVEAAGGKITTKTEKKAA